MSPRAAGVALAVLALVGIVAFSRSAAPIVTDGDFAVTELYTELATEGRLLVGPYSRFGWHHPGPIYFYVQAVPYLLGGRTAASLYATAVALNLAALAIVCWTLIREHRGPLLFLIPAACVLLAWRAPRWLASPWTAHVPILPSVAFLILCAAILAGRHRLLPLMLAVGSFVVQTHLAFGPMVGLLGAIAIARIPFDRDNADRSRWSVAMIAIGVLGVLWLPVIIEAFAHRGGNVAALWSFFVGSPGTGHTFREALIYWSYGISGLLRPDFELPWGGHFALQHGAWTVLYAIGQMMALAVIARSDLRARRTFEGWLAAVALAASAVGLWSLTRISDDILDHELFSLAVLGVVNLALVAAAVLRVVASRWSAAHSFAAGGTSVFVFALALGIVHLQDLTSFERRRSERPAIVASFVMIRDYISRASVRRPLIEMEGGTWSHTAGVILRLRQAKVSCAVRDESIPLFTDVFAVNGREDAIISIGTRARHRDAITRPGNVVLRDREPFVDAIRVAPGRGQ